ncbi:hypothetical protein JHK87_003795 [Glycine soja]|nr:hypothetical protein JHK87_003795 [Glycine soja]
MSDKEKFEVDRNEDPVSYSSGMHSDWRFGGSNLANSSVGFVGLGNNSMNVSRGDLIGSSSCSSASMVDSLSPNYWENPTSSQKLGFCDINNVHNNGGSSSTVAIRKDGFGFGRVGQDHHGTLEMGWNHANSMLPNGPVMFPHSLSQFPTDSGFIERAARFSCFSGGNFGDMVNSYGIAQSMGLYGARDAIAGHGLKSVIAGGQSQGGDMNVVEDVPPSVEHLVAAKGSPLKSDRRSEGHVIFQDEGKQSLVRNANESDRAESSDDGGGQDDSPMLEGTSGEPSSKGLNSKKRKRSGRDGDNDKANGAQELPSEGAKGNSENQQKGDQQPISTANKACGKNAKLGSQASDPPKEEYIHVRARRGQATNSHSLAERVRREKISERMKFLQDLVPGCSKVTGKAVMLDEIINYVQSLQRQVEILQQRPGPSTALGFPLDMSMAFPPLHPPQPGLIHPVIPNMTNSSDILQRTIHPQLAPLNGGFKEPNQLPDVWEDELHNVVQMSFATTAPPTSQDVDGTGPASQMKVEL